MDRTLSKLHNGLQMDGKVMTVGAVSCTVYLADVDGKVVMARGATVPSDAAVGFAKGAIFMKSNGAVATTIYLNEGTAASADFNAVESSASTVTAVVAGAGLTGGGSEGSVTVNVIGDEVTITVGADQISVKDGGISPIKLAASEARTATADGLTTGVISGGSSHVIVTSGGATDAVTLPASSAGLIGKQFTIWVGANGFELLTPAASNATINAVDADGTNQVDIPANTLTRLTLVAAGTWVLESLTALGAVATALIPDND